MGWAARLYYVFGTLGTPAEQILKKSNEAYAGLGYNKSANAKIEI